MTFQKAQRMGVLNQKMEARASVRYRFGIPAVFSWETLAGGRLTGEGITRDLGVGGAYILTPTYPPPQAVIWLEVFLTAPKTGRSLKIATEGRVLRIDHRASRKQGGFAVAANGFRIVEVPEKPN
jgi:hypothetical protein